MTGLVLKDILVMRKSIKSYGLFMIFYLVMSALDIFPSSFTTAIIQIIVMMLPIGAFSYDEMAKWDRCAMSLPLSRRAVVGGRYLFALLTCLCAAAYGLLSCVFLSIAGSGEMLTENLITVVVCLGLGLLYCDILLPLCYKLGPERSRPYLYLVIFLPIIVLFGGAKLGMLDNLDLSGLNSLSPGAVLAGTALLPLAALAGLGVSYLISCRLVEGKEF